MKINSLQFQIYFIFSAALRHLQSKTRKIARRRKVMPVKMKQERKRTKVMMPRRRRALRMTSMTKVRE